VTEDGWIAYRGAVALVGDEGAVLRALMTGGIKSQGRALDSRDPEDISADRWAEWSFLPTFKGPVPEWMRAAGWLVPPGTELRRICCGFKEIRLLRADVKRLAAPVTEASSCSCQASGTNNHKLLAVNSEIKRLGVPALDLMSQDVREHKVVEEVKGLHGGLKVSARYVRERFAEAKKQS
jgi:hypothetical protein